MMTMMKTIRMLLLCILLLLMASATSQAASTGFALVDLPRSTDRINLRKEASASSQSLGKYYSGVRVEVIKMLGAWSEVSVSTGDLAVTGYMPTQYLKMGAASAEVLQATPTAVLGGAMDLILYEKPSFTAPAVASYQSGDAVKVLGEADSTWLHVRMEDVYGYIPSSHLKHQYEVKMYMASEQRTGVLSAKGGMTIMTAHPYAGAAETGCYYNAVDVQVLGVSGPYAMVEIGTNGAKVLGFVLENHISYNVYHGDLPETIPLIRVLAKDGGPVPVYDAPGQTGAALGQYSEGTLLEVIGFSGDYLHVRFLYMESFMEAQYTEPTEWMSYRNYTIPFHFYAVAHYPKKGAEMVPVYPYPDKSSEPMIYMKHDMTFGVVAEMADWLQVISSGCIGFVPKEYMNVYPDADDRQTQGQKPLSNGRFTVGDGLVPGLYTVKCREDSETKVEITLPNGVVKAYTLPGSTSYSFYLPQGAQIALEGSGHLTGLDRSAAANGVGTEFQTNGRFMCFLQVPDGGYHITLEKGAQSGYYLITTLDMDTGLVNPPQRVEVKPGIDYNLLLNCGEFIELFHCELHLHG